MKLITVIVGARPQFIKAAALHKAFASLEKVQVNYIHTGQHYDANMSAVFFQPLGLPVPYTNLGISGRSQSEQVGDMLLALHSELEKQRPDAVLVFGDTNSTLAGALAAKNLSIPLIHVEAGIRSFNKSMPEEINRIVCDQCSTLLFVPSDAGLKNLQKEGFELGTDLTKATLDAPLIERTGDVMYDLALRAIEENKGRSTEELPKRFALLTMHRPSNLDSLEILTRLVETFLQLAEEQIPLVWPLHPRCKKMLSQGDGTLLRQVQSAKNIYIKEPLSYHDMMLMEQHCTLVLTDSGGVQKEAFFHQKPLVVLREDTEWPELVEGGFGILAGTDPKNIRQAVRQQLEATPKIYPPLYGDGKSCEQIVGTTVAFLSQ